MGIRTLCPNGHTLHVKDELSGKRGLCPECGVSFLIAAVQNGEDSQSATATPVDAASVAMDSPIAVAPPASGPPLMSKSPPPGPPSATKVAWYVRPPTGGQYGPAGDKVLGRWIVEGRITMDSHVWREGWPDWKLARDVLAELPTPSPTLPTPKAPATEPVTEVPQTAPQPAASQPPKSPDATAAEVAVEQRRAIASAARYREHRAQANRTRLKAALVLLVAVIVLATLLMWVLFRDGGELASAGIAAAVWAAPAYHAMNEKAGSNLDLRTPKVQPGMEPSS